MLFENVGFLIARLRTGDVHEETDAEFVVEAYDDDVALDDTVTGLEEPDENELLLSA